MTASAYTMEVRLIMCRSCGGPIDAMPQGGVVRCKYCSVESEVVARAKLPAFNPYAAPQISEAERIARLRAQTGQELLPPPGIAQIIGPGGTILPNRQQEALAAWQSARVRTSEQSLEAANELEFLTLVLSNQFVATKDWTRHRAMLESAFEAYFLPRHRSCIAADLVAGACRENDLAAATKWLELCDPFSDDLRTDGEYRMARSQVLALQNDFQGVLGMLGRSGEAIPVHDSLIGLVTVHRANALERLGDLDAATRELVVEMVKSPQHRRTVEIIVGLRGMCPRSFPPALANVVQQSVEVSGRLAGGSAKGTMVAAKILLVLALLSGVGAIVALVLGSGDGAISCGVVGGAALLTGGILWAMGKPALAEMEKARRLAAEGVRANGHVLSVSPTGMEEGRNVQVRVHVRVERDGLAPYEAEMTLILTPPDMRTIVPGADLPLRVNQRVPTEIALEA